ncbi:HlyD family type I secretion periplasmic adaptor subunit [Allosphingosinicella sp.]|jgi:adhesin transport system membrane fusion protein|uniref:HlyD family type I secretion periplasmic adaptor subunit n=1 Tax=Allosphingosinicella sp. TaxID=2823234 RepID=UPI002F1E31D1
MSDEEGNLDNLAGRIKPKLASNVLLWGVVGFFVVFVIWAAFTELDKSVRAQGRVIASSQLQIVSNLEGGVVEQILVQPGQMVEAGAELVRLDPTMTSSELGSGQASVAALSAKIARLEAEVAGREPVYPAAADASSAEQIAIERSLHISRMAELGQLTNAAQARVVQAQRAINEAESAYQARVQARDARRAEAAMLRPLVARGIEPRLSLMQAESAAAVAASEAAAAASAIARARASLSEAQAMLSRERQDWRARAATELAAAQAEFAARRRTMPALSERVDRTVVRSPVRGRVNRVLVTTVGGTVAPGAPMVEVVASEDSLLVEAMVRPQDIGSVRQEQRARVNITAYDPAIYGSLEGTVVSISPETTTIERTGETFYLVRVRTTSNALRNAQGRALQIGPGMVAEVNLLGEKRSILSYILSPITRLRDTAFRE